MHRAGMTVTTVKVRERCRNGTSKMELRSKWGCAEVRGCVNAVWAMKMVMMAEKKRMVVQGNGVASAWREKEGEGLVLFAEMGLKLMERAPFSVEAGEGPHVEVRGTAPRTRAT